MALSVGTVGTQLEIMTLVCVNIPKNKGKVSKCNNNCKKNLVVTSLSWLTLFIRYPIERQLSRAISTRIEKYLCQNTFEKVTIHNTHPYKINNTHNKPSQRYLGKDIFLSL